MELAPWHGLAAAQMGSVAALAGLVFVALSINLTRILEYPGLVGRSAEALVLLLLPLFTALFVLIPSQSTRAAGGEILAIGVVVSVQLGWILATSGRAAARDRPNHEFLIRIVSVASAAVPTIVAGAVLLSGSVSGMYWLVAATAMSVIVGVVDAWVLLVEILR